MFKKILIILSASYIAIIFYGCNQQAKFLKTEMDELFAQDFRNFPVPEIAKIKAESKKQGYPYVTFDEVWEATIIVAMQEGFIIRSLRDIGILVLVPIQSLKGGGKNRYYAGSPPMAIFVEKGETTAVHLGWTENLYRELSNKQERRILVEFKPNEKEMIAGRFFDKLSTQVYSGHKWKYLYK